MARAALDDEFRFESLRDQLDRAQMYPDEEFALYGLDANQSAAIRTWAIGWSERLSMDMAEANPGPKTATGLMTTNNDHDSDPFQLERFVAAQDRDGTYQRVVAELRTGAKVSHWMWFVFPQVAGLGRSAVARQYAISGAAEARAYLAHPLLGPRLRECAGIVAGTGGRSAEQIFGPVDALKLHSSMTLFDAVEPGAEPVFAAVLAKYFDGAPDEATLTRL